jgi:hypothetical protein
MEAKHGIAPYYSDFSSYLSLEKVIERERERRNRERERDEALLIATLHYT